jgi:hypothetical protein
MVEGKRIVFYFIVFFNPKLVFVWEKSTVDYFFGDVGDIMFYIVEIKFLMKGELFWFYLFYVSLFVLLLHF